MKQTRVQHIRSMIETLLKYEYATYSSIERDTGVNRTTLYRLMAGNGAQQRTLDALAQYLETKRTQTIQQFQDILPELPKVDAQHIAADALLKKDLLQ